MGSVPSISSDIPLHPFYKSFEPSLYLAKTIVECAARIFFTLAAMYSVAQCFPMFALPVGLSLTALGAPFLSIFFFQDKSFAEGSSSRTLPLPPLLHRVRVSPHAPKGIRNRRNDCWLNSALQMLQVDPDLMEWLKSSPLDSRKRVDLMRQALRTFFEEYSKPDAPSLPVTALRLALSTAFREDGRSQLSADGQEDPLDLLAPLMESLPEEQQLHWQWIDYVSTPNGDLIYSEPAQFKWAIELQANGEEEVTLESLIASACNETDLEHQTRREYQFLNAPPMLRWNLGRYVNEGERCVKKGQPVLLPTKLTIEVVNQDSGQKQTYQYELIAFNSHHGDSPTKGHYTAHVRKEDGWYFTNDGQVQQEPTFLGAPSIRSKDAYMVWYKKIEPPPSANGVGPAQSLDSQPIEDQTV